MLTRALAEQQQDRILALLEQIPQAGFAYTSEYVLGERKGARKLLARWEHSLAVLNGTDLIAVAIGYEREPDGLSPLPVLYLGELAVAEGYRSRGIGRRLLQAFLEYNARIGFRALAGEFVVRAQTNAAAWNKRVQRLYERAGFRDVGRNAYPGYEDIIFEWRPTAASR